MSAILHLTLKLKNIIGIDIKNEKKESLYN